MLTAVWVAVVAAAAAFVVGIGVAVYVMLKAARLMSETSATVSGLRERGDLLIERANAAIDQAGEQIARTETVTASMEGVTAAMAQLGGQLNVAPSALPAPGEAANGPLTWAAALVYGVRWALGARWDTPRPAGRGHTAPQRRSPVRPRGRAERGRAERGRPERPVPPGREPGRKAAAALASRSNGTPR